MISRRTVLRAGGVAMALPWLESLPVAAAVRSDRSSGFPKRFAVLFTGNGINGNHWWARGNGAEMTLSRSLQPLHPLKLKINVINGLFNKPAVGMGIHPAQTGNLLSGVPLQPGPIVRSGITADQVLANRMGHETPQASLVLACEPPMTGYHETDFSMAYSSHISWRSAARRSRTRTIDVRHPPARLPARQAAGRLAAARARSVVALLSVPRDARRSSFGVARRSVGRLRAHLALPSESARVPRRKAGRDARRRRHGARQLLPAVALEHVVRVEARQHEAAGRDGGWPRRHARDRALARISLRRRRQPPAVQPVSLDHGQDGRDARSLR